MTRILTAAAAALLWATPAHAQHGPAPASVAVCFTPASSCTPVIVSQIDRAERTIRVQAYSFTSAPILAALTAAYRRGVDVQALVDRSDLTARYSGAGYLMRAGVPVMIDPVPGIAHSKVIVIDGRVVISGSFNFTKAANVRNSENLLVLFSPEVAAWFAANWDSRRAVAVAP